ncbi:M23 family metallopeptidase [Leptospira stimsonii]|uniref:Peptidase M23 n=1 Tax=Leptospira stimsonii TaxID=2202203 RepID=A0A8B3CSU4_9LEPT|nr:M23 family metallopeptidase [Leptospira stimsonii]RHX86263.1 peptidase M23 [Leptospira stimsonii]
MSLKRIVFNFVRTLLLLLVFCGRDPKEIVFFEDLSAKDKSFFRDELTFDDTIKFFSEHPEFISNGFDFPVGAPNAKGYIDKQPFGKNFHLGEDWNAAGRNDYGDPVHSVSHGIVKFAREEGPGWGNVILLTHRLPDGRWINSLYAHLSKMSVKKGDRVRKGDRIGKIGDANRRYGPHLHFELREDFYLPTGRGYGKAHDGYLNPKEFIRANRRFAKGRKRKNSEL